MFAHNMPGPAPTEAIFEWANLFPRHTGLSVTVWVGPRGGARHAAGIKVCTEPGDRMRIGDAASMLIAEPPKLVRGKLTRAEAPRLIALFALGGLQGFVGWFMVASGFQDRVDVSQYRLVIHLMLALAIFALMLWCALDYLDTTPMRGDRRQASDLARHAKWMNILIAFQIALGGLVAGTDAGFVYNDFPMMAGHWLSPDLFTTSPWYLNFTENLAMVQFQHRLTSGFVAIAVISFLVRLRRRDLDPALKRRALSLPFALAAPAFLVDRKSVV